MSWSGLLRIKVLVNENTVDSGELAIFLWTFVLLLYNKKRILLEIQNSATCIILKVNWTNSFQDQMQYICAVEVGLALSGGKAASKRLWGKIHNTVEEVLLYDIPLESHIFLLNLLYWTHQTMIFDLIITARILTGRSWKMDQVPTRELSLYSCWYTMLR